MLELRITRKILFVKIRGRMGFCSVFSIVLGRLKLGVHRYIVSNRTVTGPASTKRHQNPLTLFGQQRKISGKEHPTHFFLVLSIIYSLQRIISTVSIMASLFAARSMARATFGRALRHTKTVNACSRVGVVRLSSYFTPGMFVFVVMMDMLAGIRSSRKVAVCSGLII